MAKLLRTPQANEDLLSIWNYVASDNTDAADTLLLQLGEQCKLLAKNRRLGQSADQYRKGLRRFPFGNYLIFYLAFADGIEVIRILHGARDLEGLL